MLIKPFSIAGVTIQPGERKILEVPAAALYTQTPMNIPVHIIHGKKKGPCLFLIAAAHGDEVNSVEIVRLLLARYRFKHLIGTFIILPVANIYGFITRSRYLPDRRDLNRSFPGSNSGSLAARLAHLFMEEIISKCTHGIDLHTGSQYIENLLHIRTNLSSPQALQMAKAFNAPLILDAKIRDGSIRQAATELNIPLLVYEGGEGLHFNELAIQMGVRGVLTILYYLKMLPRKKRLLKLIKPKLAHTSGWIRSVESGILHSFKSLGSYVKPGETLGIIADPFAKHAETLITSPVHGIMIGQNKLPLVNEGDALFHIANLKSGKEVMAQFDQLESVLANHPMIFL